MKNNKLIWHTEAKKVSSLVPNIKNPRKMSPKQTEDLKKSLQKFNLVEIPVIDTDNKVIAGHQRLAVLKLLGRGEEEIEVRVPNRRLSKKEYDQYLLSSNRIHGDWDFDILSKEFDIDLLLDSGFEEFEIDKIFKEDLTIEEDDWNDEEELKKIKTTEIKEGDMFQLGNHRLICGDGTDINVVKKLMDGEKADMVNDDIPFNINLSYDSGVSGKKKKNKYGGKMNDNKSDEEYRLFVKSLIQNSLAVSKKDCHFMFWCDERYVWLLQTLYKELGIKSNRLLIWIKSNSSPTPQSAFNKVTEFIVYGTIGSPYLSKDVNNLNEIQNEDMTTGNELLDQISDYTNLILESRLPSSEYRHPTQKSPRVHYKALKRCTKIGDIVLDLTAGSGSIMTACDSMKRKAYMCELEPVFCQLIINRFNKLTNGKAKKIN